MDAAKICLNTVHDAFDEDCKIWFSFHNATLRERVCLSKHFIYWFEQNIKRETKRRNNQTGNNPQNFHTVACTQAEKFAYGREIPIFGEAPAATTWVLVNTLIDTTLAWKTMDLFFTSL